MCYYFIGAVLLGIIFLYNTIEVNYFLRTTLSALLARFVKKPASIFDETSVKGICLTTDIDTFLSHMNNGRFLRELDFARVDFFERTGLYRCIKKHGGTVAMGANTIRYRRFVRLFSVYMITSKITYWDDQGIYMEHKFVTPRDNFVNAIAMSKTRFINAKVEEVLKELYEVPDSDNVEFGTKLIKPQLTLELEKWIESNELSSQMLRTTS